VNEIERPLRERVGAKVMAQNLDVRLVDRGEEVELEVGGGHVPFGADVSGKPVSDRAAAAADLETPGASTDSEPVDAPNRQWIETLLEQLETARLVLGEMGKRVVRHVAHAQIVRLLPPWRRGIGRSEVICVTCPATRRSRFRYRTCSRPQDAGLRQCSGMTPEK
jgi:hypothetical protein